MPVGNDPNLKIRFFILIIPILIMNSQPSSNTPQKPKETPSEISPPRNIQNNTETKSTVPKIRERSGAKK